MIICSLHAKALCMFRRDIEYDYCRSASIPVRSKFFLGMISELCRLIIERRYFIGGLDNAET